MMTRTKTRLVGLWLGCSLAAHAAAAEIKVAEVVFAAELNANKSGLTLPLPRPQRAIFVLLHEAATVTVNPAQPERTYMVARDAVFSTREAPLVNPPSVQLIVAGAIACRLHVTSEAILTARGQSIATKALKGVGCATPDSAYGSLAVVGAIDPVRWITQAPEFKPPTLVLQEIPLGMSPDSNTAKIVIPQMNQDRRADYAAEIRALAQRKQSAAAGAAARGGMLDDDKRLTAYIDAIKSDPARTGFYPDLFITAASPGRAFCASGWAFIDGVFGG